MRAGKPLRRNWPPPTAWLAPLAWLAPVPAQAYLDPSTGSMLISALVGLLATLVLAVRTYWYRLKAYFRSKPAKIESDDQSN